MKKIKIITAVISAFAVLLASFGALAVDTLDVSSDIFTGKITVTAAFDDCPNTAVSLHIVPAAADISAMSDVSYARSQLVYANQKMSDSSGIAVFEFPLKAGSGDYVVRAHSMEKAGLALQKTVNFSNSNELKAAWDNLTTDPQSNLMLVLSAANCNDKLVLSLKNDSDLLDSISAYDNIGVLNAGNLNALIARIKADCERINTFRNTAEIIKNADNVSQVKAALANQTNIAALGVSDLAARYNALKNTRPVDNALMGKNYTSASDFRADFLAALQAAENDDGSSQGGTSPSRGSSGKGSAVLGTALNVVPAVNELPFTDIAGVAWAKDAIADLYAKNIINGKSASTFAPNDYILREEFVKMTVSLLGLGTSAADTAFADVDASAWYAPYVAAAVKAGFVNGYSDSVFGIGDYITRQDVAVILSRAANLSDGTSAVEFTDKADISDYASDAVAKLSANGIINGSNGAFMPKNYSTRAETACMIYRLAAMIKEGV